MWVFISQKERYPEYAVDCSQNHAIHYQYYWSYVPRHDYLSHHLRYHADQSHLPRYLFRIAQTLFELNSEPAELPEEASEAVAQRRDDLHCAFNLDKFELFTHRHRDTWRAEGEYRAGCK